MTDRERDDLLSNISDRLGRMEIMMAEMRKEAAGAHEAIGERIHKSFMALDSKIDCYISTLSRKIHDLGGGDATNAG